MRKFKGLSLLFSSAIMLAFFMPSEVSTITIGDQMPMPNYKMENVDGKFHTLTALKEENGLLVIFSCNTCPFVIGGGKFEGWEKKYDDVNKWAKNAKVGSVLINSNEAKRTKGDGLEDMKQRAADYDYDMPYLLDRNHELADAFGAKTTPHIFLFNEKDELIFEGSIDNTWNPKAEKEENYLQDALNAVAEGKKIKVKNSAPKGCSIKRNS